MHPSACAYGSSAVPTRKAQKLADSQAFAAAMAAGDADCCTLCAHAPRK
jgi:hypothetical protein